MPAFLDRTLKPIELLHGVSFASASSGYDDLTANYSVKYQKLKHYCFFFLTVIRFFFQLISNLYLLCVCIVTERAVTSKAIGVFDAL